MGYDPLSQQTQQELSRYSPETQKQIIASIRGLIDQRQRRLESKYRRQRTTAEDKALLAQVSQYRDSLIRNQIAKLGRGYTLAEASRKRKPSSSIHHYTTIKRPDGTTITRTPQGRSLSIHRVTPQNIHLLKGVQNNQTINMLKQYAQRQSLSLRQANLLAQQQRKQNLLSKVTKKVALELQRQKQIQQERQKQSLQSLQSREILQSKLPSQTVPSDLQLLHSLLLTKNRAATFDSSLPHTPRLKEVYIAEADTLSKIDAYRKKFDPKLTGNIIVPDKDFKQAQSMSKAINTSINKLNNVYWNYPTLSLSTSVREHLPKGKFEKVLHSYEKLIQKPRKKDISKKSGFSSYFDSLYTLAVPTAKQIDRFTTELLPAVYNKIYITKEKLPNNYTRMPINAATSAATTYAIGLGGLYTSIPIGFYALRHPYSTFTGVKGFITERPDQFAGTLVPAAISGVKSVRQKQLGNILHVPRWRSHHTNFQVQRTKVNIYNNKGHLMNQNRFKESHIPYETVYRAVGDKNIKGTMHVSADHAIMNFRKLHGRSEYRVHQEFSKGQIKTNVYKLKLKKDGTFSERNIYSKVQKASSKDIHPHIEEIMQQRFRDIRAEGFKHQIESLNRLYEHHALRRTPTLSKRDLAHIKDKIHKLEKKLRDELHVSREQTLYRDTYSPHGFAKTDLKTKSEIQAKTLADRQVTRHFERDIYDVYLNSIHKWNPKQLATSGHKKLDFKGITKNFQKSIKKDPHTLDLDPTSKHHLKYSLKTQQRLDGKDITHTDLLPGLKDTLQRRTIIEKQLPSPTQTQLGKNAKNWKHLQREYPHIYSKRIIEHKPMFSEEIINIHPKYRAQLRETLQKYRTNKVQYGAKELIDYKNVMFGSNPVPIKLWYKYNKGEIPIKHPSGKGVYSHLEKHMLPLHKKLYENILNRVKGYDTIQHRFPKRDTRSTFPKTPKDYRVDLSKEAPANLMRLKKNLELQKKISETSINKAMQELKRRWAHATLREPHRPFPEFDVSHPEFHTTQTGRTISKLKLDKPLRDTAFIDTTTKSIHLPKSRVHLQDPIPKSIAKTFSKSFLNLRNTNILRLHNIQQQQLNLQLRQRNLLQNKIIQIQNIRQNIKQETNQVIKQKLQQQLNQQLNQVIKLDQQLQQSPTTPTILLTPEQPPITPTPIVYKEPPSEQSFSPTFKDVQTGVTKRSKRSFNSEREANTYGNYVVNKTGMDTFQITNRIGIKSTARQAISAFTNQRRTKGGNFLKLMY